MEIGRARLGSPDVRGFRRVRGRSYIVDCRPLPYPLKSVSDIADVCPLVMILRYTHCTLTPHNLYDPHLPPFPPPPAHPPASSRASLDTSLVAFDSTPPTFSLVALLSVALQSCDVIYVYTVTIARECGNLVTWPFGMRPPSGTMAMLPSESGLKGVRMNECPSGTGKCRLCLD